MLKQHFVLPLNCSKNSPMYTFKAIHALGILVPITPLEYNTGHLGIQCPNLIELALKKLSKAVNEPSRELAGNSIGTNELRGEG